MGSSTLNALAELCLDGREEDDEVGLEEDGMSLEVIVEGIPFTFYVGQGKQDLKWLSILAAERYLRLVKQNAKIQRFKEVLAMGRFFPSHIRIDGEPSQRPTLKLVSLVGRKIEIFLAKEIECSAYGLPQVTPWMNAAYLEDRSSRGQGHKRRNSLRQMDMPQTAQVLEPRFDSQDQTERLSREFQLTWLHMEGLRSQLFDTSSAISLHNGEEQFRDVVLRNFPFICTLFEHYAWFGRGGRPELFMTFAEVSHCVHSTQVFNLDGSEPRNLALMEFYGAVSIHECESTVFSENAQYDRTKMDQWTFDRSQFLECVLLLIAHQSTEDQLIKDLNDILSTTIAPAAKALSTSKQTTLRQVLRAPLGYQLFQEKYKQINWLFTQFITGRSRVCNAIALQEFALVLKELDEAYSSESKEDEGKSEILELYQKCTETFVYVQTLSIKVTVLSEVVLIEFLEALIIMLCKGTLQDLKDQVFAEQAYTSVLKKIEDYVSQYMEAEDVEEGKQEKGELELKQ